MSDDPFEKFWEETQRYLAALDGVQITPEFDEELVAREAERLANDPVEQAKAGMMSALIRGEER